VISNGNKKELSILFDNAKKAVKAVSTFTPIENGRPIRGLETLMVPNIELEDIVKEVRKNCLVTLEERRNKLQILLGDDHDMQVAMDALHGKVDDCALQVLCERRKAITRDRRRNEI